MSEDLLAAARRVVEQASTGEQIDVMVSRGRSTSIKVFSGEVDGIVANNSGFSGSSISHSSRKRNRLTSSV